ncbi:MAG TPA: leishmanolysin-related zinc metalloendopeptidase, partial [Gemmatimonadales bacterium]|nr:leishmanolysin-related zinc metalloendopeptidase [Gemmatimonadales bacterium]
MPDARCARLAGVVLAGLLLLLPSCGGDDGTGGTRVPTAIAIVQGTGQQGPAGLTLGTRIIAQATDRRGGVPGVTITFSIPAGQGGFVNPTSGVTDPSGQVSVAWTLGGVLGAQTLTATASGLSGVVSATATTGPPAVVSPTSEVAQYVVVGRVVPIPPAVRVTDAFGNPAAGVQVTFLPGVLGGSLTGAVKVTDPAGNAAADSWRIGGLAAEYTVLAQTPTGASARFSAFGLPATVAIVRGNGQSANAGTLIPVPPSVIAIDEAGQPLANVQVIFAVTQGGGRATGTNRFTDASGVAEVGGWILGTTPGPNQLEAQVTGVIPVSFQATGVAGTVATLEAAGPQSQNGLAGNFALSPAVLLLDGSGSPVAGHPVTFEVTQGDGTIAGGGATSDFQGRAALSAWRLGSPGPHTVRASVGALAPVSFDATASSVPASEYDIEIRYTGTQPTASQLAAFDQARARWESVILGDLTDIPVNVPASTFGCYPALNETIDDLVIFASLVNIDGPFGVLGRAGPCLIRSASRLTVVGIMEFDLADLDRLENEGALNGTILHEMAHVFGFGTLWEDQGLLDGAGSGNPIYNGGFARGAFLAAAAPGTTFTGTPIPVEGNGAPGTRDAHWRETTVDNELMTGFLDPGPNPL